jgi:hypothetical protein
MRRRPGLIAPQRWVARERLQIFGNAPPRLGPTWPDLAQPGPTWPDLPRAGQSPVAPLYAFVPCEARSSRCFCTCEPNSCTGSELGSMRRAHTQSTYGSCHSARRFKLPSPDRNRAPPRLGRRTPPQARICLVPQQSRLAPSLILFTKSDACRIAHASEPYAESVHSQVELAGR